MTISIKGPLHPDLFSEEDTPIMIQTEIPEGVGIYEVDVCFVRWDNDNFRILASSPEEAGKKAIEKANDFNPECDDFEVQELTFLKSEVVDQDEMEDYLNNR